jgi:peptidoglycan/xylan/chitin deacetylase (PgdA/CDA1 family)
MGPELDTSTGTVVLTFDNLGEASELERGTWPADEPLGRHPSVTVALPRLLDELGERELSATFFLEAINCELYPDAVREIARRGHELGMHGWRHEAWAELSGPAESQALARGTDAFRALGLPVRGFRPPGGGLTSRSAGALRGVGIEWCSPAGGGPRRRDGLAFVPFDWEFVDAYHLMARFGERRVSRGDPAQALGPTAVAERLTAGLDALARDGGQVTLVLHPFLMLDEAWFAGALRVLDRVRELARTGHIRALPGGRFADGLGAAGRE